ncbi:MAG: thioredoxin-disulfide reductase [Deltaproteobacteria bacterium]|nr:MAG: thioredoxin-disulfide reductase [Deltaproteobacteria bacterium]
MSGEKVHDLVIIGGGPAGLTAAIYASRGRLDTVVLERGVIGGQAAATEIIENYPGFPEPIEGPELMERFEAQAKRFGAKIEYGFVTEVDFSGDPKIVKTDTTEYRARTVIIATGAQPQKLGVPGEEELAGRGVSYCATCDGAFFKDAELAVVGGGDSAVEEGIFLTKFAKKVYIIHRRDKLRATAIIQERAFANDKIDFVWDSVVESINGKDAVESVTLKNVKTGEKKDLPVQGVFIYVGLVPQSQLFKGKVEIDERGYIVTDEFMRTSVPGVFAVGDVRRALGRQVATAVGDGCVAALMVEKYLSEQEVV